MSSPIRLFITGGSGQVGLSVIKAARERGITKIVSMSRGASSAALAQAAGAETVLLDVRNSDACRQSLSDHEITHIVHAAGARTRASEASILEAYAANVRGTESILMAAKGTATVKRFLHLSSAAYFGQRADLCSETTPGAPTGNYGLSKHASELAVRALLTDSGITGMIIRPGFILGAEKNDHLSNTRFFEIVKTALSQQQVEVALPRDFQFHELSRLGYHLVDMLVSETDDEVCTFIPPGRPTSIGEIAMTLTEIFSSLGMRRSFQPAPQAVTHLPERLDDSAYRAAFSEIHDFDLHTLLSDYVAAVRESLSE